MKVRGANILQVEDIAAMKLNAISGDGTRAKDFIDIYFILKQYTIKDILDFYSIKYKSRNLLHIVKSLNYFDDIDKSIWPEMLLEKDLTLSKVQQAIKARIKDYTKNHLI